MTEARRRRGIPVFAGVLLLLIGGVGYVVHAVLADGVRQHVEERHVADVELRAKIFEHGILQDTDLDDPVDPRRAEELGSWVDAHVRSDRTTKVHLWALDGTITYSTDSAVIGRAHPGRAEAIQAVAAPTATGAPEPVTKHITSGGQELLETYVRIDAPNGTVGVLELYETTPMTTGLVRELQLRVDQVVGLALLGLYVATVWLARTAQRTIRRQRDELRQALTASEAANEAKDTFLQAISHELRTPLTGVTGPIELLVAHGHVLDVERQRVLLDLASRSSKKLSRILQDILDVDRVRRDAVRAERVRTDIPWLIGRASHDLAQGSCRVSYDVAAVTACVDPQKLERVVANLLSNAVRHTPDGTIIEVHVEPRGDDLAVVVEDSGPGIAPHLREQVFEPFERGENPWHSPGTGVGLSIVRTFTELHGGVVTLDESDLGGARFTAIFAEADPRPGTDAVVPSTDDEFVADVRS